MYDSTATSAGFLGDGDWFVSGLGKRKWIRGFPVGGGAPQFVDRGVDGGVRRVEYKMFGMGGFMGGELVLCVSFVVF